MCIASLGSFHPKTSARRLQDMDDSEVDMENAEKLVVDDLRNSRQGQQEVEHKQQEQLHVEGQTSCKEGKVQKNIDIQMNHEILGGNDMEDLGGHNEILGEKNLNKKTLESGENLFEEEKDTGKSPQQSTELLSDSEVDRNGEVENKVDAACLNAIPELNETPAAGQVEPITPTALVKCNETSKDQSADANDIKMIEEAETGTPEEQAAFIKELESFYKKERGMDFKPPKFYGKILNCLKLYRAVIRLGGYDLVTGTKLWRQIGESFHPPKTCTTVSYAFRIFYEKALLEYERHKMQNGELQLVLPSVPEHVIVENQTPKGSGRARRDAAARAMQGWHEQRQNDYGEIAEPIIKEKSLNKMVRHEKYIKSTGSVKHKRPREVEHPVKAARAETSKQLPTTIVDVGPPADWVKINVRENKDCFEVYALVPGLLREEVRVQSDPEGRLVITGQPEHLDNPWGITPFQKVISLPTRIDPFQTSAVVSLHGRLFIRIPFDPSM